jgi:lauroyl/myristoyl acyltransferase
MLKFAKIVLSTRFGKRFALAEAQPLINMLNKQNIKHNPIETAINLALFRILFPWAYCRFTRCPEELKSWVQVSGLEQLIPLLGSGKGILLAGNHHGPGHMIEFFLAAQGYKVNTLQAIPSSDRKRMANAAPEMKMQMNKIFTSQDLSAGLMQTTNNIRNLLRRGEIVIATLDGRQGNAIIQLKLMGYEHGFRFAMPLVATLARAIIIPVYTFLKADGHVKIRFEKPFPERRPDQSPQEYASNIMSMYVTKLQSYMETEPGNIKIRRLLRNTISG